MGNAEYIVCSICFYPVCFLPVLIPFFCFLLLCICRRNLLQRKSVCSCIGFVFPSFLYTNCLCLLNISCNLLVCLLYLSLQCVLLLLHSFRTVYCPFGNIQ